MKLTKLTLVIIISLVMMALMCPVVQADDSDITIAINTLVITNVSASIIGSYSAIISWQTSGNATSQVFYDTVAHAYTDNYIYNTTEDTNLVTVHSIPLTGLFSSTTYHYRVKSATNGTESVSDDYTFTTLATGSGGGGGGGSASAGGGGASPGIVTLSGIINYKGVLLEDITAKSIDMLCQITLYKGTAALNNVGQPLSSIIIQPIAEPQAPPANTQVIGMAYDFWPEGATFDPPIALTLTYDPDLIPAGVIAENLVIAMWDAQDGEWVSLVSTVDPVSNTITAQVSHFTTFAVIAYTRFAAFTATDLVISPAEVDVGKEVIVSALVTNTGDLTGSYTVTLKIDDVAVDSKDVTLAGGASQQVTFSIVRGVAGTYAVSVDELSGELVVKALAAPPVPVPPKPAAFAISALAIYPTEVDIGEGITISALVTNTGELTGSYKVTLKIDNVVVATKDVTLAGSASQKVTFTTAKDVAATYEVEVDGQRGNFTVIKPVSRPFLWWWIVIGVVVVGLLVYAIILRRSEA